MKIVLASGIYPPDAGGPATYTHAMARAFLDSGHEVEIVCYSDVAKQNSDQEMKVHRVARKLPVPIRYLRFCWQVYRALKKADLVYIQGPVAAGLPATIASLMAKKPRVMKVVGDYAWEVYQGARREAQGVEEPELLDEFVTHPHAGKIRWLERIERWTAKKAHRVIVPSQYLAQIVKTWGVSDEQVRVIENAVHPFDLTPAPSNQLRTLLTVVRAVPWKQIDFIIKLLPRLPSDVQLIVAGDGPELGKWQSLVQSLDLDGRVQLVGRLDRQQLSDWYARADLFVLPSGYEGFAHVIPEAVSAGIPCFVSDRGGNPETKELLGDRITVLPYLDEAAWLHALQKPWPSKVQRPLPEVLTFPVMQQRTIDTLKEVL
ncbi:glycosyltransferase [Candidatus Uhrbacteria bacterium]|nr:glycosyltransferase [Candidatus Uhrbacteria bacterium]